MNKVNREDFIEKIKDILQYESDKELTYNSNLIDLDEWDSLSIISTVAFLDSEFGKKVTVSDMKNIVTIEDLAKIAGV